jgi:hypothetical protein
MAWGKANSYGDIPTLEGKTSGGASVTPPPVGGAIPKIHSPKIQPISRDDFQRATSNLHNLLSVKRYDGWRAMRHALRGFQAHTKLPNSPVV